MIPSSDGAGLTEHIGYHAGGYAAKLQDGRGAATGCCVGEEQYEGYLMIISVPSGIGTPSPSTTISGSR